MKNRKIIFRTVLAILFAGFVITGCKKKSDPVEVTPIDDAAQQTQSAADQAKVENESDQAMDDCNSALQGVSTTRGMEALPCGATINAIDSATGKIILNYDGTTICNGKIRSGSITIQLPHNGTQVTGWHTALAKVTFTFNDYKVTRQVDQKSITFNGTHTIINQSGGVVSDLKSVSDPSMQVIHKIKANMSLKFDDNTNSVSWGTQRMKVYNSPTMGVIQVSEVGDSSITTFPQINYLSMWGTNRAGESFKITTPAPIVYYVYGQCLYKPLSGKRVHLGVAHEITVTYGVDANGNAMTGCPTDWKANWTNAQGVAKLIIVPY